MGFKNGGVRTDADDVLRGIESGRIVVTTATASVQDVNVKSTDSPINVNIAGGLSNPLPITLGAEVIKVLTGKYQLNTGAWGEPIFSQKKSLDHGVFTFDIDATRYKRMSGDVEIKDGSIDGYVRSERGKLVISADTLGQRFALRTKRSYRYQPNRGHLYGDSTWIPTAGNGTLYMVIRTKTSNTVLDVRTEVTNLTVDITKGNVWDIQFQWRGAGDFFWYSNLIRSYLTNQLGQTTELTITNPSLPAMYEAAKGSHTIGGVTRANSAVRWGLGTQDNGIFYEWEYEDDRDPQLEVGCWDVSSEGGANDGLTYGSVASDDVLSPDGEQPSVALRVPEFRIVNGESWVNTISAELARITVGQADESTPRVYITRDTSAIALVAGTWTPDPLTKATEYIINNENDVNATFSFDKAKCILVFSTKTEADQPKSFVNPLQDRAGFWLTPGDILIVTHQTIGNDLVNVTVEFGAER